jgi:hypothetical protein
MRHDSFLSQVGHWEVSTQAPQLCEVLLEDWAKSCAIKARQGYGGLQNKGVLVRVKPKTVTECG